MKQSTMILILLAMVTSVPFFASAQTLETSISTVGCYQNTNILHSGIGVLTKTCYGNLADQKIIYFVRQDGNFEVFQQMGNVKVDSDLNFFNRHVTAYYKYLGTLGQGQWVYVQQEPLTYSTLRSKVASGSPKTLIIDFSTAHFTSGKFEVDLSGYIQN